jgi:hypothetical protein
VIASRLHRWEWEPEANWSQALARIAPVHPEQTHLVIRWVPGSKQHPVNRWIVFECWPNQYLRTVRADLWQDLTESSVDDATLDWQREYARRHNCVPMPMWVCQGGPLGHPYRYTPAEQTQSMQAGWGPTPPDPGELPYSDPVMELLVPRLWERDLRNRRVVDAWAEVQRREEVAIREQRKAMVRIAEQETPDLIKDAMPAIKEGYSARRVDDQVNSTHDAVALGADGNESEMDARYIETGTLKAGDTKPNRLVFAAS